MIILKLKLLKSIFGRSSNAAVGCGEGRRRGGRRGRGGGDAERRKVEDGRGRSGWQVMKLPSL